MLLTAGIQLYTVIRLEKTGSDKTVRESSEDSHWPQASHCVNEA